MWTRNILGEEKHIYFFQWHISTLNPFFHALRKCHIGFPSQSMLGFSSFAIYFFLAFDQFLSLFSGFKNGESRGDAAQSSDSFVEPWSMWMNNDFLNNQFSKHHLSKPCPYSWKHPTKGLGGHFDFKLKTEIKFLNFTRVQRQSHPKLLPLDVSSIGFWLVKLCKNVRCHDFLNTSV